MALKTFDGTSFRRVGGVVGDRTPQTGFRRQRTLYTATGGETIVNLATLSPAISYIPGQNQISVKRSSGGSLISNLDFQELSPTSIGFAGEPLLPNEVVEVIREFEVTGVLAADIRPDVYTVTAVTGQTLVSADFSWPYLMNSNKNQGAVRVYVHGVLQTRNVDYSEVNQGSTNTNQILFLDALAGGENITLIPSYQVIDQSAATSTYQGQQISDISSTLESAFQAAVDEREKISVPYSTIVNRAKIPNIANDLKVSFGVDRVSVQQIYQVRDEFGPNGELVWGALNDNRGLIRFVGYGWTNSVSNAGTAPYTSNSNDYIEVTFYGTGINVLGQVNNDNRSLLVSVDGGPNSANIYPGSSGSSVISNKNYAQNAVLSAAKGLSLGVHTVKLTANTGITGSVHGFEILNTSSTTNLTINPGQAYTGSQKVVSAGSSSLPVKPAALTGGRGGRVVTYLNKDGSIGQAVSLVNSFTTYLTGADHSNEEVARVYHWREFGAGRSDDFSTLTGSSSTRAFTLEDGTTSLFGYNVAAFTEERLYYTGSVSQTVFTFVGTGIDFIRKDTQDLSGTDSFLIAVDGSGITTVSGSGSTAKRIYKVASGLPYGTHTVSITRLGASNNWDFSVLEYVVYQPKKPSIPIGAVELADYNVMSDYSNVTLPSNPSKGSLRKSTSVREAVYVGTWSTAIDVNYKLFSGWGTSSSTVGSYVEYTFWGTGADVCFRPVASVAQNFTVTVTELATNTAVALNTYFTSLATITTGLTWTAGSSSGTLTGTAATGTSFYNSAVSISGLPLALYKVRVTQNGTNALNFEGFNVVVPIHSSRSSLLADLQNTLPVGSCTVSDNREISLIKSEQPKKAWAQAVGVTTTVTTSSTIPVPMPDMSVTIKTTGGALDISYNAIGYQVSTVGVFYTQVYVNGQAAGVLKNPYCTTANRETMSTDRFILPVGAGVHKVDLYWYTNANTLTGSQRNLVVREL